MPNAIYIRFIRHILPFFRLKYKNKHHGGEFEILLELKQIYQYNGISKILKFLIQK